MTEQFETFIRFIFIITNSIMCQISRALNHVSVLHANSWWGHEDEDAGERNCL